MAKKKKNKSTNKTNTRTITKKEINKLLEDNNLIDKNNDEEEKEVLGIKELFEKCEYCEGYEDDYSFYIDSACESLVDAYESIIYDAKADFPNAVYESYVEVMYEYVNNLKEWIGSFQNRKTVTGREMIERMIKRLNM